MDIEWLVEIIHHSHIDTTVMIGLMVIAYAVYLCMQGRVGSGDIAFMVLRLHPPSEPGYRKIRASTAHTTTLKHVVENLYLRLRLAFAFWRTKTSVLLVSNMKLRRMVMSEFRHHFSAIMNGETAALWASREDTAPDEVPFVFSLSDLFSSHQRKIRAIALRQKDLDWIKVNGVEKIVFSPELQFLRGVLEDMVKYPDGNASVIAFLPH